MSQPDGRMRGIKIPLADLKPGDRVRVWFVLDADEFPRDAFDIQIEQIKPSTLPFPGMVEIHGQRIVLGWRGVGGRTSVASHIAGEWHRVFVDLQGTVCPHYFGATWDQRSHSDYCYMCGEDRPPNWFIEEEPEP